MRTFPEVHHHLDSFDAVIDSQFIPAIREGHVFYEDERLLVSSRMGVMYIPVFSCIAPFRFANSKKVTQQVVGDVTQQESKLLLNLDELKKLKAGNKEERHKSYKDDLQTLKEWMISEQLRALELSSMKGASANNP